MTMAPPAQFPEGPVVQRPAAVVLDILAKVSVAFYKTLFPWQAVLNGHPR